MQAITSLRTNPESDDVIDKLAEARGRKLPPDQLQQALGEDTIQSLMQKTNLSREELLGRLSTVLPQAVDGLTPDGRVPTETPL